MKTFERLDKGNTQYKLTVTPDRVSIKVRKDTSDADRQRAEAFLLNVANQVESTSQSLRGELRGLHLAGKPLSIRLAIGHASGPFFATFRETEQGVACVRKADEIHGDLVELHSKLKVVE